MMPLDRLLNYLRLGVDAEEPQKAMEAISAGVVFRGTNLLILVFAILIASVGLNVNSTAVVIGAMLISPLMGPIMGVGAGLGVMDLWLVRRSLKNIALPAVGGHFRILFLHQPAGRRTRRSSHVPAPPSGMCSSPFRAASLASSPWPARRKYGATWCRVWPSPLH